MQDLVHLVLRPHPTGPYSGRRLLSGRLRAPSPPCLLWGTTHASPGHPRPSNCLPSGPPTQFLRYEPTLTLQKQKSFES